MINDIFKFMLLKEKMGSGIMFFLFFEFDSESRPGKYIF